jgi:hypothetical protein
MDRSELLNRVREDAQALSALANGGVNIPLDDYIDRTSLNALCDSLALDPDAWQADDLERILLIRDGLYVLRNKLRDTGDEAEHSVERILAAGDRLYADLERALRELRADELKRAQDQIAALHRGPHIAAAMVPATVAQISEQAAEVMTQAHVSIRNIEVNLLKIDRSNVNFEVLHRMKVSVQRLSASAFAIRLSLEQTVIYQGIFKLLTDGADRVVNELRTLLQRIQVSYRKVGELVTQLGSLADQGNRFSRLMAEFLEKAFLATERTSELVVKLTVQNNQQGEVVLAAARDRRGHVVLGGRRGSSWGVDPSSARISPRYRLHDGAVYCMTWVPPLPRVQSGPEQRAGKAGEVDEGEFALGTDDGLIVGERRSSRRERIVAITTAPWGLGGLRNAIVSGSNNGFVRRWTLAGGLSQMSDEHYEQVGHRVQCLLSFGQEVIAATGHNLVFLNSEVSTTRTIPVPFAVSSMDAMDANTIIMCGDGHITHLNLLSGAFSRILTASTDAEYCAVAALDAERFYFCTTSGRVGIMELASGEEQGSVDVGFALRGILPTGQKVVAFGGDWNARSGKNAALLTVQSTSRPIVSNGLQSTVS